MAKGNVLVVGNSGVGKSTLINAVLGEKKAAADFGIKGTSSEITVYKGEEIDFNLIDTVGFEPQKAFWELEPKAIKTVREWCKKAALDDDMENDINIIWFCVDGTAAKLFTKTIKDLLRATSVWKEVPIVAVITKSYSQPDRVKNIKMVQDAFAAASKTVQPRAIMPVIAESFYLSDSVFAPPEGITELMDLTNELLPEGKRIAVDVVAKYKLERRRSFAQAAVLSSTAAAATVGAVPIPFADALLLQPLEVAEINGIAAIYGIRKGDQAKLLKNTIVEVGTISTAAKAAISALKAIPGIGLATSVINAVIASGIVAALGEGSIYVFEQIYLGNKEISDVDWVRKILESQLAGSFVEKMKGVLESVTDGQDMKDIAKQIYDLFIQSFVKK
ncbi:MAG: 50S ribosome-binding GTPase [Flexilinea sp.]|nr:50S ribosome-binding GTPase [Flexilinea sp.]